MAEVVVGTGEYAPVLLCDCGYRQIICVRLHGDWYDHEQTHAPVHEPGTLTTLDTLPIPGILPPLISQVRYLA